MNYLVETEITPAGVPVTTDTDIDTAASPSKDFHSTGFPESMAVSVLRKDNTAWQS